MDSDFGNTLVALALVIVLGLSIRLYALLVLKPQRLRTLLRRQGIRGPPVSFLIENISEIKKSQLTAEKPLWGEHPASHDSAALLFPSFEQWRVRCERGPLVGWGILTFNGCAWAHQRKIIAPELFMDKVKGLIPLITESTVTLLESWKRRTETEGGTADVKIDHHMRSFSADVISRACFESNFSRGEDIFHKLRQLQEAMAKNYLHIFPPRATEAWALEKEVRSLILRVVKERKEATGKKNLLQMVLEGTKNSDLSPCGTNSFIVDNCKNIHLVGYETTAVSATRCLMLLASNPEWKTRVRTGVLQICGNRFPDADMLCRMKQLIMVIQESLCPYPLVAVVSREALKDTKPGDIQVPRGVHAWIMVTTLHTDPEIWGPDTYKFNPHRFERDCRRLQASTSVHAIRVVLCNFAFCLSTKYTRSPALRLVIEPEHGVDLQVRKLEAMPL
ncbi:hypothetical protein EUGRSUZ_H01375 [Eucalyptus grandis]|uniref:Uncharacterized protein n=2 Tax=Eucalyptus grandis TaxID=71139 RepID=A0ACC3JQR1_EUCGR|nr:hypothetical protein EUGRSUZ_H01375 [Eucalyptus grandis]